MWKFTQLRSRVSQFWVVYISADSNAAWWFGYLMSYSLPRFDAEELWRVPRHRQQCSQCCVCYAERGPRSAVSLRATRSRLLLSRHRFLRRSHNPGINSFHCSCIQIIFWKAVGKGQFFLKGIRFSRKIFETTRFRAVNCFPRARSTRTHGSLSSWWWCWPSSSWSIAPLRYSRSTLTKIAGDNL